MDFSKWHDNYVVVDPRFLFGCIYLLKKCYIILYLQVIFQSGFFSLKYTFNGYLLLFRYFEYYYKYTSITTIVLNDDFKTSSKATTARKIFIKHYRNYFTCIAGNNNKCYIPLFLSIIHIYKICRT